jgi:hypothetical protein
MVAAGVEALHQVEMVALVVGHMAFQMELMLAVLETPHQLHPLKEIMGG